MSLLLLILIIVASIIISFLILVQNSKGGGLSGSIAGFNSQFMGVKQTTDILERGTWIMAVIIALLSLFSAAFISSGGNSSREPNLRPNQTQSAPVAPNLPAPPPETPSAQP